LPVVKGLGVSSNTISISPLIMADSKTVSSLALNIGDCLYIQTVGLRQLVVPDVIDRRLWHQKATQSLDLCRGIFVLALLGGVLRAH